MINKKFGLTCLLLLCTLALSFAASPHAGFYTGNIHIAISGHVTVEERPIGLVSFTISSDGVVSSFSDLNGTITDAGTITWAQNSTGFTTGSASNGIIASSVSTTANGTTTTFRIEAKNTGPGIGETNDLAGRITQVNPTQSMRDLHRVRFVGDRFVAVGRSGLFATSFDGANWTRVGVPTTLDLYDVAYGNGRYVVVGDSSARFSSTNGVDWVANPAAPGPVAAVAFGNGKFVSMHFTGALSSSANGTAWTPGTGVAPGASYPGLDFVNGQFVAWAADRVSFSTDASEWTSKTGSTGVGALTVGLASHSRIAFGNGVYVVTGSTGLALSTDGTSWTKAQVEAGRSFGNMACVAFGNGTFVACDTADDLWTSTNGIAWKRVDRIEFRSLAHGAGRFVGVGDTVWSSLDGTSWINAEQDSLQPDLRQPGASNPFSDNPIVGTYSEGSSGLYSFGRNGQISWFKHQFAGGSGVAPLLTSETLRFGLGMSFGQPPVIVGDRGAVVVVNDRQTVTFELAPPVTSANLVHGARNDAAIVFVGSEGTIIWTTNLFRTNWVVANSGTTSSLRHVAFYPRDRALGTNLFVAVGENGAIVTSPNGSAWTRRESHVSVPLVGSAYDIETKRLLVAGSDGTLLQSTNGIVWSITTPLPISQPLNYFRNADLNLGSFGITAGGENGLSVALLPVSSGLTPTGRFTMNPISNLGRARLQGIALGNGRFVAVGDKRSAFSLDGRNWEVSTNGFDLRSVAHGKGHFVAVGQDKTIVTSVDGWRWQLRTNINFSGLSFRSVVYSAGRFAAVGERGLLMTSEDGLTWTSKPGASASVTYNDITANGVSFLAGGTSGTVLLSSDGGNTWIEKPTFGPEIKGVSWGQNRFVAVSLDGWSAVSTNGLTWERKQTPFISPVENRPAFSELSFAGGTFYAPSTRGEIFTSTNGLDWRRNFTGVGREFRGGLVGNGAMLWLAENEIYSLNVPDAGSPVITQQPASGSFVEGIDLVLEANAAGASLEFSWIKDGAALINGGRVAGANSASLHIQGATAEDAGHYTFTVSNSAGSRSSVEVEIRIVLKPRISAEPAPANALLGSKTVLHIESPSTDASIQWFKNGVAIEGATLKDLSLPTVGLSDAGVYFAKLSNRAGNVQSTPVVINVISAPPGLSLDPNWPIQPIPFANINATLIQTIVRQSDGKFLVGGYFRVTTSTGSVLTNILRLNADGSIDTSFTPPLPDNAPSAFFPLANGKVLVMGLFDSIGGVSTKGLARLNADGSLDKTYVGGSSSFNGPITVLPRSDGALYVGGFFTQLGGAAINYLGLLRADGTPDTAFRSSAGLGGQVSTMDLQADGALIAAGKFPQPRSRIMRLTATGAEDTTFNPGKSGIDAASPFLTPSVAKVRVTSDGRIYAGGVFGSYNGTSRPSLLRLEANGTLDPTFNANLPGNGQSQISDFLPIGPSLLIAGTFNSLAGNTTYANLAMIDSTGAPSPGLTFATPPNGPVQFLAADPAGNVLIAGGFTLLDGKNKPRIARLIQVTTTPLPLALQTQPHSQTVPIGGKASFHVTASGHGSLSFQWNRNGTPLSGQTQPSLILPTSSEADIGTYTVEIKDINGSAVSQPATLSLEGAPTGNAFSAWATSFGITPNLNGLSQDADGDGYSNAAEFAFGTNPVLANNKPRLEQQSVTVGNQSFPAIRYVRNRSASGVTIEVRASTSVTFGTSAEITSAGAAEDLGNGLERITVRATTPLPTVTTFFFQIRTSGN